MLRSVQLLLLCTKPEYTAQVAAWEHTEWHFLLSDETVEGAQERLAAQEPGALPLTIIALETAASETASLEAVSSSNLLGCVTLDQTDLPGHDDLTPWLASLYVPPAFRGRGVGRRLAGAARDLTRARGYSKLYLYTWEHSARYARWGFQTLRTGHVAGREVVVMERTL